jgi:outer membrane protein TolC
VKTKPFVLLALFAATLAAVEPAGDRLALGGLVAEALRANPEIQAAQKRYEAARQRPAQASSLPDPMVSLGYNSSGSPRPFAGLGTDPVANAGVMVSQEFPFPGKRKLAGDMAVKEAEAEFQQYQQAQLSVVSRLKQAYYRLAYTYDAAAVLERNRDLLDNLLRITESRYSVGRAAQQDVFNTQTQLSILATRLVQIERERHAREAEINALVNRPPGSPLARPADLAPRELAVNLDQLYAQAEANSPMLGRDRKMIERAAAAVNLARKQYYPDYSVSAGYYNMGRMPDMYMFRVDLKIPLYFFRKQRAGVAEQAHSLDQARREFEATGNALQFRIKDDYLMAESSARLATLYHTTVIPQSDLTLESSLSSYETGALDFGSVLANYITRVEYEMNYYEELQNLHVALSRLEEMTGVPLIG